MKHSPPPGRRWGLPTGRQLPLKRKNKALDSILNLALQPLIASNSSDPMSPDDSAAQAHCRRIAALAVELGRRAGVPAEALAQAALLHHAPEPLRHSRGLDRLAWQVVGGDDARRIADIVQICNLVDGQLESLEFEHKEVDTILEEIRSFAVFEVFDPALVDLMRGICWRVIQIGRAAGW